MGYSLEWGSKAEARALDTPFGAHSGPEAGVVLEHLAIPSTVPLIVPPPTTVPLTVLLSAREQRVTGTIVFVLTGISVFLAPVLKVRLGTGPQIPRSPST